MATRDVLKSDGPNLFYGHLNSTSGVLYDRKDLLADLQREEEERETERVAREQGETERQARRFQRENSHACLNSSVSICKINENSEHESVLRKSTQGC